MNSLLEPVSKEVRCSLPYPKGFLERIEKSNFKNINAKLALIVLPKYDCNNLFSSYGFQFLILQVARIYSVALVAMDDVSLFGQSLRDVVETHRKPISLLFLGGHGTAEYMRFRQSGPNDDSATMTELNIQEADFLPLTSEATIILCSCWVGQKFGPEIARISGRSVQAPVKTLKGYSMFFYFSENQPKLLSYSKDSKDPNMFVFEPNAAAKPLSYTPFDMQEAFSDKLSYYRKYCQNGQPQAQYEMARFINYTWSALFRRKNDEETLPLINSAASKGLAVALSKRGEFFMNGRGFFEKSDKNALNDFLESAKQGEASGKYYVGLFYEEGRGGLVQSEVKALACYLDAARHGYILAQTKVTELQDKLRELEDRNAKRQRT